MEENKNINIEDLIVAYLSGDAGVNEMEDLKKWLNVSSENRKYFLEQQELWFSSISEEESSLYNKEKAYELFRDRTKDQNIIVKEKYNKRFPLFFRYAAVVALLFIISIISYYRGSESVKKDFAQIVVEAPIGSRTKLNLPDGTLVWLNAGSKISYSQGFGVNDRKVLLQGECYFEVKHNTELPFFVKSKDLQVRVVGTKFNFRDYPEDKEVMVSLIEGRIALNNLLRNENEAFLNPNQRVVMDKTDGRMKIGFIEGNNSKEWTNGYLFFDEDLMTDIVKELQRSYNVKFTFATDSLKKIRFYGNFVRQEQTIEEVLNALTATGKIHYVKNGHTITLY